MEENKKFLWGAVIVLALVAAALAYGVYNRYAPSLPGDSPADNAPQSSTGGSPQPGATPGTRTLTSAEARILAGVASNATDTERQAYTDSVIALAEEAGEVSIRGCAGSPLVAKASKQAGGVTFRNEDSASRLLAFNNGKEKFTFAAGESKKITPSFAEGFGFYTYTCDNQTAGILIVGE